MDRLQAAPASGPGVTMARVVARGAALLALLAGAGCALPKSERRAEPAPAATTTTAPVAETTPKAGNMTTKRPGNKTPYPPTTYAAGPALSPTAPLLTWLDAHRGTSIKVPVVLRLSPDHLGIEASYLGATTDAAAAASAIHVDLGDSKLGVSLMDHVRRKCGGQPVCVLWLEGRWGALSGDDTASTAPRLSRPTFSLDRVHDPVEPNLRDPHVWLQKEAGAGDE